MGNKLAVIYQRTVATPVDNRPKSYSEIAKDNKAKREKATQERLSDQQATTIQRSQHSVVEGQGQVAVRGKLESNVEYKERRITPGFSRQPTTSGRLAAYSGDVQMFPGSLADRQQYLNNPRAYNTKKYFESVRERDDEIRASGFNTVQLFKGKEVVRNEPRTIRGRDGASGVRLYRSLPSGEIQTPQGTWVSYFDEKGQRITHPKLSEKEFLREDNINRVLNRRSRFFEGEGWKNIEAAADRSAYLSYGENGPTSANSRFWFDVRKGAYTTLYGGGLLAGVGAVTAGENMAAISQNFVRKDTVLNLGKAYYGSLPSGEIQTPQGTWVSYFDEKGQRITHPKLSEKEFLREDNINRVLNRRSRFFEGEGWKNIEAAADRSAYLSYGENGPTSANSRFWFDVRKGAYTTLYGGGLLAGVGAVTAGENMAAISQNFVRKDTVLNLGKAYYGSLPSGEIQTPQGTWVSYFDEKGQRITHPKLSEKEFLREDNINRVLNRRSRFFEGEGWKNIEAAADRSAYLSYGENGPTSANSRFWFDVRKGAYTTLYGGGLLAGVGAVTAGENMAAISQNFVRKDTVLNLGKAYYAPANYNYVRKAVGNLKTELTSPLPGAREVFVDAPKNTIATFNPSTPEGALTLTTAATGALFLRPAFIANPATRAVMTKAYPDTYKYADDVNIKFFQAHTDETTLPVLKQSDGRTVKTVHVTVADPFQGGESFVTVAMPEGAGGFRQANQLYNFYKSSPVPESIKQVKVGGYKTRAVAVNQLGDGPGLTVSNKGFSFKPGRTVSGYAYDQSTGRAYLGYAGIGDISSSGSKVILGSPQVKLLVGRDFVTPTPASIATQDVQAINRYQVARGGRTFVPAENLAGRSVEGQLISPSSYQALPNYKELGLTGLGTQVSKAGPSTFVYYPVEQSRLFGLLNTKKYYKFELIPVKYGLVDAQTASGVAGGVSQGSIKPLDMKSYGSSYGKVRYVEPSYDFYRVRNPSLSRSLYRSKSSSTPSSGTSSSFGYRFVSSSPQRSTTRSPVYSRVGSRLSSPIYSSKTVSSVPSVSSVLSRVSSYKSSSYKSPPYRTPPYIPSSETSRKFFFKLPKLSGSNLATRIGAYRVTEYAPSFSALYFKQMGRAKRGKLSSSGLDYRPVLPGTDITKTRYNRRFHLGL
jgi:hypothetical protein